MAIPLKMMCATEIRLRDRGEGRQQGNSYLILIYWGIHDSDTKKITRLRKWIDEWKWFSLPRTSNSFTVGGKSVANITVCVPHLVSLGKLKSNANILKNWTKSMVKTRHCNNHLIKVTDSQDLTRINEGLWWINTKLRASRILKTRMKLTNHNNEKLFQW